MLAQGDETGAIQMLSELEREAEQRGFSMQQPRIATLRVRILLRQGHIDEATALMKPYYLPLMQARLHLARGNPAEALEILADYRQQMKAKKLAR